MIAMYTDSGWKYREEPGNNSGTAIQGNSWGDRNEREIYILQPLGHFEFCIMY